MLLAHDVVGLADGPPLVLIHGITESRAAWDPLVDDLGSTYRLLLVDLRGHGASEVSGPYDPLTYAADVIETMADAEFTGAPVIGHSLGGIVASAVAAMGGTTAVINIDQSMRLSVFKALLAEVEPLLKGDEAEFAAAVELIFQAMVGPLPAAEVARIDGLRRARPDVVLGTWATVFDSTTEELDATVEALAATITVPYLALHGVDPGPGYGDWLGALVPTATVEVWDDHGHYPHLVDQARFTARVRAFIDSA